MTEITYLVLSPGQMPEPRRSDLTYSQIVEMVGSPIEVTDVGSGLATMYHCAEGMRNDWPENQPATRIAGSALREGTHVAGTALIVGPMAPGGIDTSLPDEVMADLMREATVTP